MSEVNCKVTASGGRSGVRPCPGDWCGLDDINAWLASSRVVTAYALDVAQWLGDSGYKPQAIQLLEARKALSDQVAVLQSQVTTWGVLLVARIDVDEAIARLIELQDAVCVLITASSDYATDASSAPPREPERWQEITDQAAKDAAAWSLFPDWSGIGDNTTAVVVVAAVALAVVVGVGLSRGGKGRRR